ncbi:MAG: maleylpyruvate isomerase family mycothiol-dependent enzyme [Propionibacteriaceae bacterium]|nr:maleylpyruvate isomerase family mycothiol-dependent enzyme [Propionibacteriaceae bacterium]
MAKSLASQAALFHDLGAMRESKLNAVQMLLGSTIAFSDDDWHAPSLLPGWTRAHIAAHLASNADAFVRMVAAARAGDPVPLYDSAAKRWEQIERGARRSALELQTDLDASATRLDHMYPLLSGLDGTAVPLWPGQWVRADLTPLARLNEVTLHHVDLDAGFGPDQIEDRVATWLLQWNAFWLAGDPSYPAIELVASSGLRMRVGSGRHRIRATGPDAVLLCWLTGRISPASFGATNLPILPLRA